VPRIQES